jgi:hypothetical protein
MDNLYHYYINAPVSWSPTFLEPNFQQHNKYDLKYLSQEYIDWLYSLGLTVTVGEQFVTYPNQTPIPIHVDDPSTEHHVKLNFVYCDSEHVMIWYKLKPECHAQEAYTNIGTHYKWAKHDDCEEIYRARVGQPSIINAAVLHGVGSVDADRYCFSFSLAKINSNEKLTWKEAISIFKEHASQQM